MAYVRKDQANLSESEWDRFIVALGRLHGTGIPAPKYRDFLRVHVEAMDHAGMGWGVHTMMGVDGRNFLAWHRQYLLRFEQRLRQVDSSVALPYWDWIADRSIPSRLDTPQLRSEWGIRRDWDPDLLPEAAEIDAILERKRFRGFQIRLETVHGWVHVAVGGTMRTSSSPADPLFWLHHANIDRLWAKWQRAHPRQAPSNRDEVLAPPPIFGNTVESVLRIRELGYRYE